MFPAYEETPTSPDEPTRRALEAADARRRARLLAEHRAARERERAAIFGDASPEAAAARGVRGFRERLASDRALAAHRAGLAAERRRVFGDRPPGGDVGDFATFARGDSTAPMPPEERDRLLAMTERGRDLLRRSGRAAGPAPGPASGREELDRVLSLTQLGRSILRGRAAGAAKPRGA